MNIIDLRMDNGLAEKKEDGTTIHVDLDDVRKFYGETAHYLLMHEGRIQIVDDPKRKPRNYIIVK